MHRIEPRQRAEHEFGSEVLGGTDAGSGEGEAPADYGGSAYTLTDVTFSLQPANQGPQAFGDYSAAFDPKIGTKVPTSFCNLQLDALLGQFLLQFCSELW